MVTEKKSVDWTNLVTLMAAGLLFLSFGYTEIAGSDMWWNIAAGREILQTGTLWMVDDWSFTALGHDWHNHEWLAALFYYAWASALGVQSLVYWKWLMIVATFGILLLVLKRSTGSAFVALLCAGFAVANAARFLDVRPHLYTLLGFSILLLLRLERPLSKWWLALIFIFWVNLHGGFMFGLLAMGILIFPWREPSAANIRSAFWVGMFCALACLVNPYGYNAFLFPLEFVFDYSSPYRAINEWQTPFKKGGMSSPLFFYLAWLPLLGSLYLLPSVKRSLKIPWEGIALTLLTLIMALSSRRFIPLFGISLALMLAPLFTLFLNKWGVLKYSLYLVIAVFLYAFIRTQPYPTKAEPAFHYLTSEFSYPVEMLNFIETNQIKGNVFTQWDWGGYIHWRADGNIKVFIDGRANTVYDNETYRSYYRVQNMGEGWLKTLEDSQADYMLWSHTRSRGQEKWRDVLATGRWRQIYSDDVSWLLARNATVPETKMKSTSASLWQHLATARNSERVGDSKSVLVYAEMARQLMPWNKSACELLVNNYRKLGEPTKAQDTLTDCLAQFPTAYLR